MRPRTKKTVTLIAIFAFISAVLSIYFLWETDLSRYDELEKRFVEYYELEKSGKWGKAITYRTPVIQRAIETDYYISQMHIDDKGWKLKSYKIRHIEKEHNKIKIAVDFVQQPSKEFISKIGVYAGNLSEANEITFKEWSVWKKIDGVWYCEDAASRGHLPLNAALAFDDT